MCPREKNNNRESDHTQVLPTTVVQKNLKQQQTIWLLPVQFKFQVQVCFLPIIGLL